MRRITAAAFALAVASSLHAQTPTQPGADYSIAVPIAGSWTYATTTDGSAATFRNLSAAPQLTVRCIRATRRVSIAKPASAPAASLTLWTSNASRVVPASFDPTTAMISIQLAAYDPLLDALAFSRARFAVVAAGSPPLVLPAWPEIARVIEDCRA